jgi:acyl carrier protein phosphodiesterase
MNFLAHCALAKDAAKTFDFGTDALEGLLAGAVIGDFVKGRIPTDWPVALQAGVRLHRKIDAVSNRNNALQGLSADYPAPVRRFAPIFLDLLADYCLASNWPDHYTYPLKPFSQDCYDAIAKHQSFLPDHGVRFFDYMQQQDLLANYHQWAHVRRGIESVLRRLGRPELLDLAQEAMLAGEKDTAENLAEILTGLREGWQDWSPL